MLEDEEIRNWLDEQLKEIPEGVEDISFCFPGEEVIKVLKNSEKYKGITVHFFSSSWIKEPQLLWMDKENKAVFPWLEEEKKCESQEL